MGLRRKLHRFEKIDNILKAYYTQSFIWSLYSVM